MNTSKKIVLAFAACAGLGTLTLGSVTPAFAQAPRPPRVAPGDRIGFLLRSYETLLNTETDLRRAGDDYGGHKATAADRCHAAQDQIVEAIQFYNHAFVPAQRPQTAMESARLAPGDNLRMLRRGFAALKRTEFSLRRAGDDYGGHRLKAADLCRDAQGQLVAAIQFANHH